MFSSTEQLKRTGSWLTILICKVYKIRVSKKSHDSNIIKLLLDTVSEESIINGRSINIYPPKD